MEHPFEGVQRVALGELNVSHSAGVMQLWSNGHGLQKTLDQVQMDEVLAVEAYPHPGVTPPEFMGSPCAAIMLWMKEGGTVLSR